VPYFQADRLAAQAWRVLVLLLLSACGSTPRWAGPEDGGRTALADGLPDDSQGEPLDGASGLRRGPLVAGHSVQGRPIEYRVHGRGQHCVLLLATIHGDEAAGTALLEQLSQQLDAHEDGLGDTRVVVVPLLNPDGRAAHRRPNARGVDLNRNFPASNRPADTTDGEEALSEPEARALMMLLERFTPERVLSIHGWLGLVDWDGPAEAEAKRFAQRVRLPARRLGGRPGSLGSYLGLDRGVPVITLELPGTARTQDAAALWERYGPALLEYVGLAPGNSPPAALGV